MGLPLLDGRLGVGQVANLMIWRRTSAGRAGRGGGLVMVSWLAEDRPRRVCVRSIMREMTVFPGFCWFMLGEMMSTVLEIVVEMAGTAA